jgi:hypothetical protein
LYPKPNLSRPAPNHEVYPYLLRGVSIERPNQVWSTDISKRLVDSVLICPEVRYSRKSNLGGGSERLPVMRHQFAQPGDRVTGDA